MSSSIVTTHERTSREGEVLLNEAGYELGQIVYMDGQHDATIKRAYSSEYDANSLATIVIEMDVELFQSIRPDFKPSGFATKVQSVCHLGNFTSEKEGLI